MKVADICKQLKLQVLVQGEDNKEATGVIAGDLLSFIIGKAEPNMAWVTIQTHINVAAVASLKELSLIVIASGRTPAGELVEKCKSERITLAVTDDCMYKVSGKLYKLGI